MAIQWNLSKTDHQMIDVLFIVKSPEVGWKQETGTCSLVRISKVSFKGRARANYFRLVRPL